MRPVYGLNDEPRRWWNRLGKFIRAVVWSLLGQIGVPMSAMKEPGGNPRLKTSPTRPA